LLLTARDGSTWALIEFACLPCYAGNTLCSQRLEALYKSPNLFFMYFLFYNGVGVLITVYTSPFFPFFKIFLAFVTFKCSFILLWTLLLPYL
jgi:hypothetical protein